jgi:hypothetical protein
MGPKVSLPCPHYTTGPYPKPNNSSSQSHPNSGRHIILIFTPNASRSSHSFMLTKTVFEFLFLQFMLRTHRLILFECKLWSTLVLQFSPTLGPNILYSTLSWNTRNTCSSLNVRETKCCLSQRSELRGLTLRCAFPSEWTFSFSLLKSYSTWRDRVFRFSFK